jgi:transportin-1
VRQSAFALVGDLARAAPGVLVGAGGGGGAGPALLAECVAALDGPPPPPPPGAAAAGPPHPAPPLIPPASLAAANNACWALGELGLKVPPAAVAAVAEAAAGRLLRLLSAGAAAAIPRSLVENAAITLGRLAWAAPDALAPAAPALVPAWCAALRGVRDDTEKEHAFLGLAALLRRCPSAGAPPAFAPLAEAVASWRLPLRCEGLAHELAALVRAYRDALGGAGGAGWAAALAPLPPGVRERLAAMCGL